MVILWRWCFQNYASKISSSLRIYEGDFFSYAQKDKNVLRHLLTSWKEIVDVSARSNESGIRRESTIYWRAVLLAILSVWYKWRLIQSITRNQLQAEADWNCCRVHTSAALKTAICTDVSSSLWKPAACSIHGSKLYILTLDLIADFIELILKRTVTTFHSRGTNADCMSSCAYAVPIIEH
jgi:hypothetical protein